MSTLLKSNRRTAAIHKLILAAAGLALLGACATAPDTVDNRNDLRREADTALRLARSGHPGFSTLIRNAPGYAVFPDVAKAGALVGGAYGRGIVFRNGTPIGYTDLSQASIGLQFGGQAYTEILVFETTNSLNNFLLGNYQFSSQATAVALRSGDGANARFEDGIAVFTVDEAGLMFEAVVGGQKFTYQAFASN